MLELIAVEYGILTLTWWNPLSKLIPVQMGNVVALLYHIKMGDSLIRNGIMITVEYLPGAMNKEADWKIMKRERFKLVEAKSRGI